LPHQKAFDSWRNDFRAINQLFLLSSLRVRLGVQAGLEIRWQTAIASARIVSGGQNVGHSAAGNATRKELATITAKSRTLGYQQIPS
jgi:hypothetical protein